MLGFIISVSVLVLLALLLIVPALLKKPEVDDENVENFDEQNIRIARERIAELKVDLEQQRISQEIFEKAKDELEKNLALDLSISEETIEPKKFQQPAKILGLILVAVIPAAALLIYLQLGNYQSIEAGTGRIADKVIGAPGKPQMTMQQAVSKLRERLDLEPNNPQGWFMLARSYVTLERYADAAKAYQKTVELNGEDADLLLRYADTLVMRDGGKYTEQSTALVKKSLMMAPQHPQALWMAGMAEDAVGNTRQALVHWYTLDPLLNDNVTAQTQLRGMIKKAEKSLSSDELTEIKQSVKTTMPLKITESSPATGAVINVNVSIDESLKNKVSANDTVFIFAKALQGPPMPLAAIKKTVADLPLTLKLTDAMAMMPQMKLSNFKQVRIAAVISKSGQPGLNVGDLFGEKMPITVASSDQVSIVINQIK